MTTTKEQIRELQRVVGHLQHIILELAGWELAKQEWSFVGMWDCPVSPSGLCCYNHYLDPLHDHCLFCGQPEERK